VTAAKVTTVTPGDADRFGRTQSGHYRACLDLYAVTERDGRFLVADQDADGLRMERSDRMPFDITWRHTSERMFYHGWHAQRLSGAEYRQRLADDITEYAETLQVLLDAHAAQTHTQRYTRCCDRGIAGLPSEITRGRQSLSARI
jgi:hypothetical protein